MSSLARELRRELERTVKLARRVAEAGARKAIERLGVGDAKPPGGTTTEELSLRLRLRAHGRQLGDQRDRRLETQATARLVSECAYEHWHRMLFARFLAENELLIEPQHRVAISLEECQELARERGEDWLALASEFAVRMLPQIFRSGDPVLEIAPPPETRSELEDLLGRLPRDVFLADDSLGWVYQFWQSDRKDEVNKSETKIGADELPAVTQLFTEDYMVLFLLHNTLGAWWAGKALAERPELAASAASEGELRRAVALTAAGGYQFEYLRFVRDDAEEGPWRPAAGIFNGWPKSAAEIKVLDPCCGSGHFLVAAFELLVRLRMQEEGLDLPAAVDAVLGDNLFGLELDARCTQIAAFNLAFAAWKLAGFHALPTMSVACTGLSVGVTRDAWMQALDREGTANLRFFFGQLYDLFIQAPTLGSLINPSRFLGSGMLDRSGMQSLFRALGSALAEDPKTSPERHELGVAAAGLARASGLLADRYTLVLTNVPYLGRGKQVDALKEHLETYYPLGKADLATAFVLRCLEFCAENGTTSLVTPQNWLFLTTYTKMRELLLDRRKWELVARLGPGAFETIGGHVVNVALLVLSARTPVGRDSIGGIDVSNETNAADKAAALRNQTVVNVSQSAQLVNPDARVVLEDAEVSKKLSEYADSLLGLGTGDFPHYGRCFWEFACLTANWAFHQCSVYETHCFAGREHLVSWDDSIGRVRGMLPAEREQIHNQDQSGQQAWGKRGVAVSLMHDLKATLYTGEKYEKALTVLLPKREEYLPAIWALCDTASLNTEVRKLDQKIIAANGTVAKIPFDLTHWMGVAAAKFPQGLPEPESDDPTQWLFHGRPEHSTAPLQVAVARLLGYRWPAELDDTMRLSPRARELVRRCDGLLNFADTDGIVCIPSVRGEDSAADRLFAILSACGVTPDRNLDDWLRNDFFKEHCELFHQRPFIWHVWDGRKSDGFHALVNYHRLAAPGGGHKLLESLTYTHLGQWIARQKDGVKRAEEGAEGRLAAATELQSRLASILEGEPPFDVFVRWKPLHEQPLGWQPDINDGVRMNIRPFLAGDIPGGRVGAGVLRWKPNIKWGKDRGKEPKRPFDDFPWFWGWNDSVDFPGGATFSGERWNDCHYTLEFKRRARQRKQTSERT